MHYRLLTATLAALVSLYSLPAAAKPTHHFSWVSSAPLIKPGHDPSQVVYGVKDPSVVYVDGKYHVFMTTAGEKGWGLAYTSFADWSQATSAPIITLDKSPMGPGYRAAPQVFYFAPQKLWYLVYQGGDPLYSTSSDISDPESWSAPKPFLPVVPDIVKQPDGQPSWLDFWVICDDAKCYLFFTNDNGSFFRAETSLNQFPNGFGNTVLVMKEKTEDMFEASNTYKIAGTDRYITTIEAMSPKGRYFRIWESDRLDGTWRPMTSGTMNIFASTENVTFSGAHWSEGVSHGEMIRTNPDQTLSIDPCKPLEFLYQGLDPNGKTDDYIKLPYSLGVITAKGPNPISELCQN